MAFLLAIITPPAIFYGWFEVQSRTIADRYALDAGYANALKHAEAAATLYSALRLVGISSGTSERAVLRLGVINEFVEMYVKRGRRDTTLEMMRDLHNNMVGIAVAKWRDSATASDRRNRSEQLVVLAREAVLLRSEADISLPPEETRRAQQSADLDWATRWFELNKMAIENRAMQALLDPRS